MNTFVDYPALFSAYIKASPVHMGQPLPQRGNAHVSALVDMMRDDYSKPQQIAPLRAFLSHRDPITGHASYSDDSSAIGTDSHDIARTLCRATESGYGSKQDTCNHVQWTLMLMGVQWVPGKAGTHVLAWPTLNAAMACKPRNPVKLGKLLRKVMNPELHGSIESIVDTLKIAFDPTFGTDGLTFEIGHKRADFEAAYVADTVDGASTLRRTSGYSSLSLSCMQKPANYFGTDNMHPARAYGRAGGTGGDFEIATLWDGSLLAARVILARDGNASAPIYTAYANAGDVLRLKIKEARGCDPHDMDNSFSGYSLGTIEVNYSKHLCPYLDSGDNVDFDSMEIGHGDSEPTTSGAIDDESGYCCDECGDRCDEYETTYVESEEVTVCNSCLEYNFFNSDLSNEWFRDNERVEVDTGNGWNESWAECEVESEGLPYSDHHETYLQDYVVCECGEIRKDDDNDVIEIDGSYYVEDSDEYSTILGERIAGGILALLAYLATNPLLSFNMLPQPKPSDCAAIANGIAYQRARRECIKAELDFIVMP